MMTGNRGPFSRAYCGRGPRLAAPQCGETCLTVRALTLARLRLDPPRGGAELGRILKVASLLFLTMIGAVIYAQTQVPKDLATIHWPDVSNLEPQVRDQLLSVEKTLTAVINNASLSDSARATEYGEAGRIYHAYSLTAPARECYLNANVLAPKDFRWLYLLAKIDQQEGRVEDAIRRFEQAAALNPEYVAVDVNLGNVYLELNRAGKAETSFRKALAQQPKNPAALYGLGQLALSARRYADAITYFEKALEQVPGANRIHYSLALAYRGLGDIVKAESHLAQRGTVGVKVSDRLIDELPDLIEGERIHLVRGRTAVEAKRFADAAVEFLKAIAARPESVGAHLNLATTLVQLNDLNDAAAEFKTVLRLEPENANAHFNLAIVLDTQHKYNEAIDELRALLKSTPGDTNANFFLAKELLKAERRSEALTELVLVMNANPDNEEALLQTVDLLLQERQYADALALLERANAQYPQKPDQATTLADLMAPSPSVDVGAR